MIHLLGCTLLNTVYIYRTALRREGSNLPVFELPDFCNITDRTYVLTWLLSHKPESFDKLCNATELLREITLLLLAVLHSKAC